jgi:glyoxylase-like metal-dependent hydrolase (beta-lactamase superfamily II)
VVAGERVAVIEPATPHGDEQAELLALLERLAAEGRELACVLVTHHHPDHIGFVDQLRDRFGVPVAAHPATAARVPFAVDRALGEREGLDLGGGVALRAVFTPGHAPGHLVYVEERSRIAHVGDMVAGEGTILIDPDDSGDMGQYLDSLRRLPGLDIAAAVPAHGPVIADLAGLAQHYVAHRLGREAKVVAALERGLVDTGDVLAAAYDDTPRALWPLAARSLEAHLRKLEKDGRIERDGASVRLLRSDA